MRSTKIGILGGTFDPVHNGHLELAKAALLECGLDHIEFIPAAYPPHKEGGTGASFSHRLNMTKLLCESANEFSCNDIEGSLAAPSYSIDTLDYLENILPVNCQLYFIIGVDAFLEIELWKSFQEVLQRVNFIISPRRGYALEKIYRFLAKLGYQRLENHWQSKNSFRVLHLLNTIPQNISSTLLKACIKKGENIDKLVPLVVKKYIFDHKLYLKN